MSTKDILYIVALTGAVITGIRLYEGKKDFQKKYDALVQLRGSSVVAAKGNPVVHFEVGCRDLAKEKDFYTKIFGWSSVNNGISENFNTNSPDGIQGHLTALGHEPFNYVSFYIQVDDIKQTITQITAAGGKKIVGPFPLPDKKQFAWVGDPEGNIIGLLQNAP